VKSNSQSEKGTESQNYFRTQKEQFERIESTLNLGSKQYGNLNAF
jgi:hypothetical protein